MKYFQLSESFELKGGIDIKGLEIFKTTINAGLKHQHKDTNTLSHEESSVNKFFEENHGEIHTGKAVCYADDLRIVRNVRPKFSTEFLQGNHLASTDTEVTFIYTISVIYSLFHMQVVNDFL